MSLVLCSLGIQVQGDAQTGAATGFPGGIDLWAGRSFPTHISLNLTDYPWPEQLEAVTLIVGTGPVGSAATLFLENLSIIPKPSEPSEGLVISPGSVTSVPFSNGIHLEMELSIDWNYSGPDNGTLRVVLSYRGLATLVGLSTNVEVVAHRSLFFAEVPTLTLLDGRTVENGTWLSNNTQIRFVPGRLVYNGSTKELASPQAWTMSVVDESSMESLYTWTRNVTLHGVSKFDFTASTAAPFGLLHVSAAPLVSGLWPGQVELLTAKWTVGIDGVAPSLAIASPAGAGQSEVGPGTASFILTACDNESGIDSSSRPVSYMIPGNGSATARWVFARMGDPCAEGIVDVSAMEGDRTLEVHVVDRAGNGANASVVVHFSAGLGTLSFSGYGPTGWVTTHRVEPFVRLTTDPAGTGPTLVAELSIADRPTGLENWLSANMTFAGGILLVTNNLSVETDGVFFVVWRARAHPDDNWTYSQIVLLLVDSGAPYLDPGWNCSAWDRQVDFLDATVGAKDDQSGVDLNSTYMEVNDGDRSWNFVPEIKGGESHNGTIQFHWISVLSPGTYRFKVVLADRAGNNLTTGSCQLTLPNPPLRFGVEMGLIVFLIAVAASGWLFLKRRRHGRPPLEGE